MKKSIVKLSLVVAGLCALVLAGGPIMAAANIALVTAESGPLVGGNVVYIEGDFTQADKAIKADTSYYTPVIQTQTGHLYLWGDGSNGESAMGYYYNDSNYIVPVHQAVGLEFTDKQVAKLVPANNGYHMLALMTDGTLFGWGQRNDNQLGEEYIADGSVRYPGTYMYGAAININLEWLGLQAGEKITDIASNYHGTIIMTDSGRIITFGDTNNCTVGYDVSSIGHPVPPTDITNLIPLQNGEKIVSISSGYYSMRVITDQHHYYAWGQNSYNAAIVPGNTIDWEICTPTDITPGFSMLSAGEYVEQFLAQNYKANVLALTNLGNLYAYGGWWNDEWTDWNSGSGVLYPTFWASYMDSNSQILTPTLIASDVDSAFLGSWLGDALTLITDGGTKLFYTGDNQYGEAANGSWDYLSALTDITGYFGLNSGETFVSAFCNEGARCVVVTSAGRVFTWGWGSGNSGNAVYLNENRNYPTEITDQINGSGLATISSVYFGANAAADVQIVNGSLLRVVVPAGASLGQVDVIVNGASGELTRKSHGYEYVDGIGNGDTIKCDTVPGAPNTGLSSVVETLNSPIVKVATLVGMAVAFGAAGILSTKLRAALRR